MDMSTRGEFGVNIVIEGVNIRAYHESGNVSDEEMPEEIWIKLRYVSSVDEAYDILKEADIEVRNGYVDVYDMYVNELVGYWIAVGEAYELPPNVHHQKVSGTLIIDVGGRVYFEDFTADYYDGKYAYLTSEQFEELL